MKYYYTYKVQCTAVGREDYYYLGKHVTSNLNDGYKGSGKKLKEYYNQYPNDYTFTILEFYSNKTELNIAEQKLIGDLWKSDSYCLNRMPGGSGSWKVAHENNKGRPRTEEEKRKISENTKRAMNNPDIKKRISESQKGRYISEEHKRKISESQKGKPSGMKGKHQSEEAKRKISEARKGRHKVYREDGTYLYK